MEARGNERTNAEYEWHGVSGVWKPVHDEGRDYREVFIRSKYRDKKFMRAHPETGADRPPRKWDARPPDAKRHRSE